MDSLLPLYKNKIEVSLDERPQISTVHIADTRLVSQQYPDFSQAFYSPSDAEDFATDMSTDSAPSPSSPLSPEFAGLYSLPQEGDWMPWDKAEFSAGLLKAESPFEDAVLPSVPQRSMSLSPAINPMDLSNPLVDDVLFVGDGINDNQPLFQGQFPVPAAAAARPQPKRVQQQQQQQQPARQSTAKKLPQPASQQASKRYPRANNLKRKSCPSEDDEHLSQRSSASPPPNTRRSSAKDSDAAVGRPKKSAHNMIEKRYRNNLNDKIAALRDSVPALRVMVHRLEPASGAGGGGGAQNGSDADEDEQQQQHAAEDLGGLMPAHKLNKATILGKATEYIMHLERRNRNLARENAALQSRVEGFEMLVMSRDGGAADEGR